MTVTEGNHLSNTLSYKSNHAYYYYYYCYYYYYYYYYYYHFILFR